MFQHITLLRSTRNVMIMAGFIGFWNSLDLAYYRNRFSTQHAAVVALMQKKKHFHAIYYKFMSKVINVFVSHILLQINYKSTTTRGCHDRRVVGFITTLICNRCLSPLMLWV